MKKILDFLTYIWDIITMIFQALVNLFNIILAGFQFVINLAARLPASLSIFIVAVVAVCVIYKIVSLGGSGE